MKSRFPFWRWLFLAALSVSFQAHAAVFSADGRYFVFATPEALVANDTNSLSDVYRVDRQAGGFVLVSLNRDRTGSGDLGSFNPVISADGSVVAFFSEATNLVSQDNNGFTDVFVRDLTAGTTTLISVNHSGSDSGNGASSDLRLSADGRVVAFGSVATDLVATPPNPQGYFADVFVRDRVAGVTTLVSANQGGTANGNTFSYVNALSADGRVVIFNSDATNLVSAASGGRLDLFARNLAAGVTSLVNMNQAGTGGGNSFASQPSVSADGTIVAFISDASDLVSNDHNGANDVFVRNLTTGVTRLASANLSATGSGNGGSGGGEEDFQNMTLSADGGRVAFTSHASDLVANDGNGTDDIFVRDLVTGSTLLVSRNLAGTGSANRASLHATMGADGTGVAFWSFADDLTPHSVDGNPNLFLFDLTTGAMRLASINRSGSGSGSNDPDDDEYFTPTPAVSGNGAVVAFRNLATNLISEHVAGDLFLFDADQTPPDLGTYIESSGLVVMEAEHFDDSTTASGHFWEPSTALPGFVGGSAMWAGPNTGADFKTLSQVAARSPSLTYRVQFTTAGNYNFWVRGWAANGSDDSVNIGVDGANIHSLPYPQTRTWVWRSLRVVVPNPGLHAVNLWMREDGAYVDRLLLAANLRFIPTGDGPPESGRDPVAP